MCTEAENDRLLVWITSPLACKVILKEADRYAKENSLKIVVVSIQSPITDDWTGKAMELEILQRSAREIGAELNVEYSENFLKSAFVIIKREKPVCMFAGVPSAGFKSAFLENICNIGNGIPVYTVDKQGNCARIDELAD